MPTWILLFELEIQYILQKIGTLSSLQTTFQPTLFVELFLFWRLQILMVQTLLSRRKQYLSIHSTNAYSLQLQNCLTMDGDWKTIYISPIFPCCKNGDEILCFMFFVIAYIQSMYGITLFLVIVWLISFLLIVWLVFHNLNRKGIETNISERKTNFMTTSWYLWKWKNKTIFEVDFQRSDNPTLLIQRFFIDIGEYNM